MQIREILCYFSLKYNGDVKQVFQAIKDKEKVTDDDFIKYKEIISKTNYITVLDDDYPVVLRNISYLPPIVLFYKGDISLLKKENVIAIIGTRKNSSYGKEMTKKIVSGLKNFDYLTISGLAYGIDSICHLSSLDNNIKTIAVLGSGIDYCYPEANQEIYNRIANEGLIISEYPGEIEPKPENFLIRNRIIAGIAKKILVTEAMYKSGTMNTVACGLENGKDIYAVPYLATATSGCNYLIKQGAKLVETAKDLFD